MMRVWTGRGKAHLPSTSKTQRHSSLERDVDINDLKRSVTILRAILAADERGQGVGFAEAMEEAEVFCCEMECKILTGGLEEDADEHHH
jgi:hypothetical protein